MAGYRHKCLASSDTGVAERFPRRNRPFSPGAAFPQVGNPLQLIIRQPVWRRRVVIVILGSHSVP